MEPLHKWRLNLNSNTHSLLRRANARIFSFRISYNYTNYNNIFISYIKYTSVRPPANSKANRGRRCEDGLRLITLIEVKKK